MFLTKTYDVEDCINYDAMTSNSGKWTIPSTVSISEYSSNGWKYGNASSFQFIDLTNTPYSSNYSVEITINSVYGDTPFVFYFESSTAQRTYLIVYPNKYNLGGTEVSRTFVSNQNYRLDYTSNGLSLYIDGTLIKTISHNIGDAKIRLATGVNRYAIIKDLKIKPL